jgi:hypothetical protein
MKAEGIARQTIVVIGAALVIVGGCGPATVPSPTIPSNAPQKAMETYDTDKNGTLDSAELEKAPGLKAAFAGSGKVAANDIAARIADWKRSGYGRLSFILTVKHNGRPLPGATVTLVPETFLGNEFQPAVGETDASGTTVPTVAAGGPDAVSGAAQGFYRVQVTKIGASIPAKYNTKTILGLEVSLRGQDRQTVLDLKY